MAARVARKSAPHRRVGYALEPLFRAGLDTLDFGFAIFDRKLELVACNRAFRTLRGYPAALCRPGTGIVEFYRFNAKRGDDGPGDDVGLYGDAGVEGRVIRQEQDGFLLVIDQRKLTGRAAPTPSGRCRKQWAGSASRIPTRAIALPSRSRT